MHIYIYIYIIYSGNQKKSGPGRRSNAENAIAFYEYVLGEGDIEVNEDDNDDDDDEEEEEEEEEDESNDGRKNNNNNDDDDDDDNDNQSESSSVGSDPNTVESMDTQEFLNQHNDECEVCNLPGELLCCSLFTCISYGMFTTCSNGSTQGRRRVELSTLYHPRCQGT
jgi:hypothetical protein